MSKHAWKMHDSIKKKQELSHLLERPMNLDAARNGCSSVVKKVEERAYIIPKDQKARLT